MKIRILYLRCLGHGMLRKWRQFFIKGYVAKVLPANYSFFPSPVNLFYISNPCLLLKSRKLKSVK